MKLSVRYLVRRVVGVLILVGAIIAYLVFNPQNYQTEIINAIDIPQDENAPLAIDVLAQLEVKGRAPKNNYERSEFYDTWPTVDGCNLRQRIILRDFGGSTESGGTATTDKNCNVTSGTFYEPYTGEFRTYNSKTEISKGIQIDHVVALSDAWQKGAQYMDKTTRYNIATDPLNLIAVDSSANQQKSDGDAATWLPKNKSFRCQYVARQVAVKYKYKLWVTEAEKNAITNVLKTCPNQTVSGLSK